MFRGRVIATRGRGIMTMRAARRLLHFGALAFLTVGVALGGQTAAEQLSLLDLAGRSVNPLQATNSKATVFLFIRSD